MNIFKKIISGASLLLTVFFFSSCEKELSSYTEPAIEIQEEILAEAEENVYEVALHSTYPWYAVSKVDWIKVTKNRGQALLDEKVVFKVSTNESLDPREGVIQIRLMDQMTTDLLVKQDGLGNYVTLPMDVIYFNNEASSYKMEVLTRVDWTIDKPQHNGFTFKQLDKNHLEITASANTSGKDREVNVTIASVSEPDKNASLKVVQKGEKDILSFVVPQERDAVLIAKKGGSEKVTIVLNKKYTARTSAEWIQIDATPKKENTDLVENLVLSYTVRPNDTMEERTGQILIEDVDHTCSDVLTIYQRGVSDIVYCKAGGSGDGTSWDRAFGDFAKAMAACGNHADQELWVSEGVFEINELVKKKTIQIYGGFRGDEIAVAQRDMKKKTTLKGKRKFLVGYTDKDAPADKCYFMDGFILTGVDEPGNSQIGVIEFYQNHGLRNSILCNNTYGKNAGGYFENTKVENCLFYGNVNTNSAGVVQINGTDMLNCTIVNNQATGDWTAAGGIRVGPGSRMINTVVWGNVQNCKRAQDVQVYMDKDGDAVFLNCWFQMGKKKDGTPTMFNDGFKPKGDRGYTELSADNAAGARFLQPSKGDFHLGDGSILKDKGNDDAVKAAGLLTDMDGNARISGRSSDIGAFEIQ